MKQLKYVTEYTVNKGVGDWEVWTKASDYLADIMIKKRKKEYVEDRITKPVKVRIEVYI